MVRTNIRSNLAIINDYIWRDQNVINRDPQRRKASRPGRLNAESLSAVAQSRDAQEVLEEGRPWSDVQIS